MRATSRTRLRRVAKRSSMNSIVMKPTLRRFTFAALALAGTFALAADPGDAPHAYRAARLWTGTGPAVADGVLVVRGGKVVAAGRRADVQVPAGAVVHDLGDA